jgi:hypothetical protein
MLATPGCCAREDMGAAFAGVFCGVLQARLWSVAFTWPLLGTWSGQNMGCGVEQTYGAAMLSSFLFRIGSDILTTVQSGMSSVVLVRRVFVVLESQGRCGLKNCFGG